MFAGEREREALRNTVEKERERERREREISNPSFFSNLMQSLNFSGQVKMFKKQMLKNKLNLTFYKM